MGILLIVENQLIKGAGLPFPVQETANCSPDRMRSFVPRERPEHGASSHLEAGNDSGGLGRPTITGLGREHFDLRSVVRELVAAVETDNVSFSYRGCQSRCDAACPQGDRETAPLVPATEDDVEQTLRALLD